MLIGTAGNGGEGAFGPNIGGSGANGANGPLQAVFNVINDPTEALFGRPLIGNGANAAPRVGAERRERAGWAPAGPAVCLAGWSAPAAALQTPATAATAGLLGLYGLNGLTQPPLGHDGWDILSHNEFALTGAPLAGCRG